MRSRPRLHISAVAILAVIATIGGGCGGSDGGSSTATASISKADFIKKADAICSKAAKQTQAEFAEFAKKNQLAATKEPTPAQYAELGKTILIPALKRQVSEIQALGAPSGDEQRIADFLTAVEQAIKKAEAEPQAARSPEKLLVDADKLIATYGFEVCGQR